jgi:hypothetical protein
MLYSTILIQNSAVFGPGFLCKILPFSDQKKTQIVHQALTVLPNQYFHQADLIQPSK